MTIGLVLFIFALVAVAAGGLGLRLKYLQRKLAATPKLEALAPSQDQMKRLQDIADVPMAKIIEAAERRATHPDEPVPQILVDLDPSLDPQTRVQDTAVQTAQPTVPTAGDAWVDTSPSLGGFLAAMKPRVKREPVPDPYAKCTHWEAERQEICSLESAAPVKTIVTDCPRCDRVADLRAALSARADEIKALAETWEFHGLNGAQVTEADYAHYKGLLEQADAIKREITLAAVHDEADRVRLTMVAGPHWVAEPWPGHWRTQFQELGS